MALGVTAFAPDRRKAKLMESSMTCQVQMHGKKIAELNLDQLATVSAGTPASDYASTMRLLSNCLRMMHDIQKAVVSNIR